VQLVGALSDPTTELGYRGLDTNEYNKTLDYVRMVMLRSLTLLRPKQLAALDSNFQHMNVSRTEYSLSTLDLAAVTA
jgi:hypothetical protein